LYFSEFLTINKKYPDEPPAHLWLILKNKLIKIRDGPPAHLEANRRLIPDKNI